MLQPCEIFSHPVRAHIVFNVVTKKAWIAQIHWRAEVLPDVSLMILFLSISERYLQPSLELVSSQWEDNLNIMFVLKFSFILSDTTLCPILLTHWLHPVSFACLLGTLVVFTLYYRDVAFHTFWHWYSLPSSSQSVPLNLSRQRHFQVIPWLTQVPPFWHLTLRTWQKSTSGNTRSNHGTLYLFTTDRWIWTL